LAESKYPGCTRLAEILGGMSHDSVNRFLVRERYEPKDLFDEVKPYINLSGGTLSGDDTVIDKPYSDPELTELIGYFWSGKHHRVVKGIQLITLYYTDVSGKSVPVNYRLYNKQDGQTKNDYLREMIVEVLSWGLQPKIVTTDAWYSSRENLKFLKNKDLGCLMGVAKNRSCSINGQNYVQVQHLEIPDEGLVVHLKSFGRVKVFRSTFKNKDNRYYIMFLPDEDALELITRTEFKALHSIHWGIECYHRAIKQVCGIERFMVSQCVGRVPRLEATGEPVRVRTTEAVHTHFFSSIRAFTKLELMRSEELIENWYEIQRNLSIQVARDFILEHLTQKVCLNAHSQFSVNA
jgi:Transposase DDE domain